MFVFRVTMLQTCVNVIGHPPANGTIFNEGLKSYSGHKKQLLSGWRFGYAALFGAFIIAVL